MSALLNVREIAEILQQSGTVSELRYAETVDSTNEWAKREAADGAPDGTIYLADHQTAGKGSRGRVWKSPEGTSVAMSILLRPSVPPERYSMLTLVMGLAAARGMEEAGNVSAGIKWPNDIVCGGRKLCGILTEMGPEADYVVIGIGLNINMTEFSEELRDTATSVAIVTGKPADRERITAQVIRRFAEYYRIFQKTGDLSGIREDYESILVNRNQRVRVLDPEAPFCGTALGIDDRGRLLVRHDDGNQIEKVYAGEVSVRGIYGYV